MPPKSKLPECGFAVGGTKKGELPLKVEKRARGKKVTIIANVIGDALKLVRALQALLGVGGTTRYADGGCTVEVQGDQTGRVTKALLDFGCLRGLSQSALDGLRGSHESGRSETVVARTDATKFLQQTQGTKPLSPAEERRLQLEQEADFYGRFWQNAVSSDDFADIWDETLNSTDAPLESPLSSTPAAAPSLPELNTTLLSLGLLPDCGRAVREFWEGTKLTIAQFRKAIAPGARLIDDVGTKKAAPSNLRSRQKLSDFRSSAGGGARSSYFSATCSVIDDYQKGIVRTAEEREAAAAAAAARVKPQAPQLEVQTDAANGWCTAVLSYVAPLPVPTSRLEDDESAALSKIALRAIEPKLSEDLGALRLNVPGVECRLDCDTFGVDLKLSEEEFLHAPRKDAGGKAPDKSGKEEMKLEKKLREICALRKRQQEGEVLEKLQAEKLARKDEHFKEVAELKLRRAEKELIRIFKRHIQRFQDAFWEHEWQALYGDEPTESSGSTKQPFGTVDMETCEPGITVADNGSRVESKTPQWVGARLHVRVRNGEVGAFAVEVLEGLVRVGWEQPNAPMGDLAASGSKSYGYGGTGKKIHDGAFEAYGPAFRAGDVIHCEAEREDGRLRIGFAKNDAPCGVAYDVEDRMQPSDGLVGAVCGKGFKLRIVSAESMPLDEAPGLDNFLEFDPPRLAVVVRDVKGDSEDCLSLIKGESVHVASDDGEGWLFGFFLDPEDPDDGGWFPTDAVRLLDEDWDPDGQEEQNRTNVSNVTSAWDEAPLAAQVSGAGVNVHDIWETAPPAPHGGDESPWDMPAPQAEFIPVAGSTPSPTSAAYPHAVGGASAATPSAPAPATTDDEVPGLKDWLQGLSLQKHAAPALAWCRDMGAVSIDEIRENWKDFADDLGLKPLERKRLEKAVAAATKA